MTENKFLNYLSKRNNVNPAILRTMLSGNNSSKISMIVWDGKDKDISVSSEITEEGEYISYHRIQECFRNPEDLLNYILIANLNESFGPINYLGVKINDSYIFSLDEDGIAVDFVIFDLTSEENVIPFLINARKDIYIPSILKEGENFYFKKGLYFLKANSKNGDIVDNITTNILIKEKEK